MDRERFDALARLFAGNASRRRAIAVLLAAGLLAPHADLVAGPGKGSGHRKCRGQGHLKGANKGHRDGECDTGCPLDPRTGKPGFRCRDGSCSCGGKCCARQCFYDFGGTSSPVREFCCTGPKRDFCPNSDPDVDPLCCASDAENPCSCVGPGVITGTYRRR
jgi:hypothetical protein